MALKSSREGLRKELVDYLGNIIIDKNLKQNIINSVDDVFINNEELTISVNELDEKIRNETSARESADTNLSDIKANKSDVLTLEEIQASTDLSGKIASASSLKTVFDISNLSVEAPYTTDSDKEHIINNCKYISSLIPPYMPRMLVIEKYGRAFVFGFTYNQSNEPEYAQYLYHIINHDEFYLVNCFEHTWKVHKFTGVMI